MEAEMTQRATAWASVDVTEHVNLALDAAALMVVSGGPTIAANQLLTNLLQMFKSKLPLLAWRTDFILGNSEQSGEQTLFVRTISGVGVNLSRVSELLNFKERAVKERMTTGDVACELKRIGSLPSPYNRWISILAAGTTAGAFSQIALRDGGSLALAFVAAVVGQYFRSTLLARQFSGVTTTLIAAVVSAALAAIGLRLGITKAVTPTLIASVIYMAPGLPLINGFLDIASQKYLIMGLERIANAALLFLAMAIAIGFAFVVVM